MASSFNLGSYIQDVLHLPATPIALSTAHIYIGLVGLLSPATAYRTFGLPLPRASVSLPAKSVAAAPPSPFLYAKAGRDITLGVAYLAFALQGNHEVVRTLVAASTITAAVDGTVVALYGDDEGRWRAWAHIGGAVGLLGIVWGGWGM